MESVTGNVPSAVLLLVALSFVIYQKTGRDHEVVEEFKKLRAEHDAHRQNFTPLNIISPAVAQVIGVFRVKSGGFEPLGRDTPLRPRMRSAVTRFFDILDLNSDTCSENLIIDAIYDNLSPLRLQDLRRGTDIPHGVALARTGSKYPPYEEMHDIDGRSVYPRTGSRHGADPDRAGGSLRRWDGLGLQPGEWRVHKPGV